MPLPLTFEEAMDGRLITRDNVFKWTTEQGKPHQVNEEELYVLWNLPINEAYCFCGWLKDHYTRDLNMNWRDYGRSVRIGSSNPELIFISIGLVHISETRCMITFSIGQEEVTVPVFEDVENVEPIDQVLEDPEVAQWQIDPDQHTTPDAHKLPPGIVGEDGTMEGTYDDEDDEDFDWLFDELENEEDEDAGD